MTPGFRIIERERIIANIKIIMMAYRASNAQTEYHANLLKLLSKYNGKSDALKVKMQFNHIRNEQLLTEIAAYLYDLTSDEDYFSYDYERYVVDIAENLAYTAQNRRSNQIIPTIRSRIAALFQRTK